MDFHPFLGEASRIELNRHHFIFILRRNNGRRESGPFIMDIPYPTFPATQFKRKMMKGKKIDYVLRKLFQEESYRSQIEKINSSLPPH